MMERQTLRQLRGAIDLVTDGVDKIVKEIEVAHQTLARRPYALLARIGPIAQPVRGIEQVQMVITAGAYGAIYTTNRVVGGVAASVLDQFEP